MTSASSSPNPPGYQPLLPPHNWGRSTSQAAPPKLGQEKERKLGTPETEIILPMSLPRGS